MRSLSIAPISDFGTPQTLQLTVAISKYLSSIAPSFAASSEKAAQKAMPSFLYPIFCEKIIISCMRFASP